MHTCFISTFWSPVYRISMPKSSFEIFIISSVFTCYIFLKWAEKKSRRYEGVGAHWFIFARGPSQINQGTVPRGVAPHNLSMIYPSAVPACCPLKFALLPLSWLIPWQPLWHLIYMLEKCFNSLLDCFHLSQHAAAGRWMDHVVSLAVYSLSQK